MFEWQNVNDKTYGGKADNESMERLYNQTKVPKKPRTILDFFRLCMFFGLGLILLAIVLAGFFSTVSSILGLSGCMMTLGGILGLLISLIIVSIREKRGL